MLKKLEIKTGKRAEMLDITSQIQAVVSGSGMSSGFCVVYVPHTTAGITINENADPSVKKDILEFLEENVPNSDKYHHTEGNADSHIKATLTGSSVSLLIEKGKLVLGTWQGVFLCEFDGPRWREVWLKILAD